MFEFWIAVASALSVPGLAIWVALTVRDNNKLLRKLSHIQDNAIMLFPKHAMAKSALFDYGHMVGVCTSANDTREAWAMSPETAKIMYDALGRSLKQKTGESNAKPKTGV